MAKRRPVAITNHMSPADKARLGGLVTKYLAGPPPQKPVTPPGGFYDPALSAQRAQSTRGLGDLRQDTDLGNARAAQDYTFGIEGLTRDRDRGYEDIDRQVAMLTRSYGQLARRQAEGAAVAGVLSPGLAAKSMQVRAANMALDRQPLDTARTRLGQDFETGKGRLDLDYTRGVTDRGTGLARAEREDTQFGLDIGEQQRYQAIGAGWTPPAQKPLKYLWSNGTWHSMPEPRRR